MITELSIVNQPDWKLEVTSPDACSSIQTFVVQSHSMDEASVATNETALEVPVSEMEPVPRQPPQTY